MKSVAAGMLLIAAALLILVAPAHATCTTCTAINNVCFCASGTVREFCQTNQGNPCSCTFSGHSNCGGGGSCFLPSTLVMTSVGLVAVSDIQVGDMVLSRDESGEDVWVTVEETYKAVHPHGYFLINGTLGVTAEHPFRVGDEWVQAQDLLLGDQLIDVDGRVTAVESIEEVQKGVRVYNINTRDTHTFFAGGFWVHNKEGDPHEG